MVSICSDPNLDQAFHDGDLPTSSELHQALVCKVFLGPIAVILIL
jgi:hypothetical protein